MKKKIVEIKDYKKFLYLKYKSIYWNNCKFKTQEIILAEVFQIYFVKNY